MQYIEDYVPVVKFAGLNTAKAVDFTAAPTVALPAATTIDGQSVVALASITSSATTGTVFPITMTGIYTGAGAVVIVANSATTGVIQSTTANGLTTGGALLLTSTGTLVTTGYMLTITANSATTAAGLLRINGAGLTSGKAIVVASAEAALTSGMYMDLGTVFTVSKFGATVIAGSASGTAALTLTAGDFVVTSGFIVISANAKGITFTGTGANGGVLKNLKNAAASGLSGTQLDVEIDIGGTPYYFTVYPTKA